MLKNWIFSYREWRRLKKIEVFLKRLHAVTSRLRFLEKQREKISEAMLKGGIGVRRHCFPAELQNKYFLEKYSRKAEALKKELEELGAAA